MKKCMGCMRDYSEHNDRCPVCGYSEEEYRNSMNHTPDVLPPETIIGGRFILGRVLSCSDYSIVYIAWDALLLRRLAIKEYFPLNLGVRQAGKLEVEFLSQEDKDVFEQGRRIFEEEAMCLNRNQDIDEVVSVYRCIRENQTSYVVMEYMEGCTLQDFLDDNPNLDSQSAKSIFAMIIEGVQKLHERGIGHYNLTPDNIYLVKRGKIRFLDFGGAKKELFCINPKDMCIYREAFIAPEILRKMKSSRRADLYSLGILYYYIMTRKEMKCKDRKWKMYRSLKMNDKSIDKIIGLLTEVQPKLRPENIAQLWQSCSAEEKRRFLGNGQK